MTAQHSTYYDSEIKAVIEKNDLNNLDIKFIGGNWASKWLRLNDECIDILITHLKRIKQLRKEGGK